MIIKRYPNRKLYNTEARRYITLDGIAELLREGKEVQVIDFATGEDFTTQVLSQVIAGQEKRRGGFIPGPVLAGLVQAGGATLDVMRRAMLLPLDLIRNVDDEIQHRIEVLVQDGELSKAEGIHWVERLLTTSPRIAADAAITREFMKVMQENGIPTHDEFEHLSAQVDELARKLDELRTK